MKKAKKYTAPIPRHIQEEKLELFLQKLDDNPTYWDDSLLEELDDDLLDKVLEKLQEIFDEVFVDADYYRTMIDYIATVDNRNEDQLFYHREHQGTTALRCPRSGELNVNKVYMEWDSSSP